MSERYLVTGVQLGMMQALQTEKEREKLVDEIVDKQFISSSGQPIEADVTNIIKMLGL